MFKIVKKKKVNSWDYIDKCQNIFAKVHQPFLTKFLRETGLGKKTTKVQKIL